MNSNRQKKKILFFIPTLFQGGGERVVSELSLHLPDSLERVLVLFEEKISYPYKGKVVSLRAPLSTNGFLRIWYFFLRLFRFRKVLREERPDYVISLGNSANIINVLVNKRAIVRVDLFLSESSKGFWGLLFKVFVRFLFPRAERVISVSRAAAQDLVDSFSIPKEKIQVIYNPIDIERIRMLAQEQIAQEYQEIFSHPVIITMGRLTKQKGQRYLLSAFADVKRREPGAKLVILGEGELRDSLAEFSKTLDLEESVHFLGWQKNPFAFLRKSTLFVLPSLWEGLPDVLLEAMACGLPVISTDCKSGPREILAPSTDIKTVAQGREQVEYGFLVPINSPGILSAAIAQMLSDPRLCLEFSQKARIRAEDFRAERILKEWKFLQ
ncbi:MAG: glycosyltransferase [Candidatus Yanofskybacteria bacterium]|nr:glycosyltransferase [Candidatus Yanofskybacteria bacterium]